MFIDRARLFVKAGDGGNGKSSFRREKFVPAGGPSGGDGGKGGDIYFVVDKDLRTLTEFKFKRHFTADPGGHGGTKDCFGRGGQDIIVKVPPGTVVKDADTGEVVADLTTPGHRFRAVRGGRGGRGNSNFATPTRRAPIYAEKGAPGEERWVDLELKLLADVGLVGFPNAGKSTIISRISAARPKIADYPFTTLEPNLGVVDRGDGEYFVVADIPGLIEGAHEGHGLGHQFLRHVERCRALVYVVDIAGTEGRDPVEDFEIVCRELALHDAILASRPGVVAANKTDVGGYDENLERLIANARAKGFTVFPVSGVTGQGMKELVTVIADMLGAMPAEQETSDLRDPEAWKPAEARPMSVEQVGGAYVVTGSQVERLAAMTDYENEAALRRFQKVLKATGVVEALKDAGASTGDSVAIGKFRFDYVDEES